MRKLILVAALLLTAAPMFAGQVGIYVGVHGHKHHHHHHRPHDERRR